MGMPEKALLAAVISGDAEAVAAAIAAGADCNATVDDGLCPLQRAAAYGYDEVIRLLLAAGADLHAKDDAALLWAVIYGCAKTVHLLLTEGANVHARNDDALRTAATFGHAEVVRILLATGANVHAEDDGALYAAATNGHTEVARLLIAAAADPVSIWSKADSNDRALMVAVLDACADAMMPAQCVMLASKSEAFANLRAAIASSTKNRGMKR